MIKRALPMLALAALFASTNLTANAQSKGDQALLDALVRKGVLTDKEATEISAETANLTENVLMFNGQPFPSSQQYPIARGSPRHGYSGEPDHEVLDHQAGQSISKCRSGVVS